MNRSESRPSRRIQKFLRDHGPLSLVFGLLVPLIVAVGSASHYWWFTIDDSFISFRYARNFANGLGLVFNPGEPVEGYTNFAWTVILGWGMRLGLDPVALSKILGVGAYLTVVSSAYFLSRRILPRRRLPPVAPILLATTPVLATHAVLGLETAMFAACVFGGTLLFVGEEQDDRRVPLSGLLFALGTLTRPEGPMVFGVAMLSLGGPNWRPGRPAFAAARRPAVMFVGLTIVAAGLILRARGLAPPVGDQLGDPGDVSTGLTLVAVGVAAIVWHVPAKFFERRNLVRGALFVGPVLAHTLWRHAYYGAWLPNTVAAKVGDPSRQVASGWRYVENWMNFEGSTLALVPFGMAAALTFFSLATRTEAPEREEQQRWFSLLSGVTVFGLSVVVLVGGDWMPTWRFIAHYQAFAYLLVGLAVRELWHLEQRWLRLSIVVGLAFSLWERQTDLEEREKKLRTPKEQAVHHKAKKLIAWFGAQERVHGRENVYGRVAFGDIGEFAYVTDYPIIDYFGLVDPVIARLKGGHYQKSAQPFTDRMFEVSPRYMLFQSELRSCNMPMSAGLRKIRIDARFEAYEVIGQIPVAKKQFCVWQHRDYSGMAGD